MRTTFCEARHDRSFDYEDPARALKELCNLSWWRYMLFELRGVVSIGRRYPAMFREPVTFYLLNCRKHGPSLTYAQGFEKRIVCAACWRQSMNGSKQPPSSPLTRALLKTKANIHLGRKTVIGPGNDVTPDP